MRPVHQVDLPVRYETSKLQVTQRAKVVHSTGTRVGTPKEILNLGSWWPPVNTNRQWDNFELVTLVLGPKLKIRSPLGLNIL